MSQVTQLLDLLGRAWAVLDAGEVSDELANDICDALAGHSPRAAHAPQPFQETASRKVMQPPLDSRALGDEAIRWSAPEPAKESEVERLWLMDSLGLGGTSAEEHLDALIAAVRREALEEAAKVCRASGCLCRDWILMLRNTR